MATCLVGQPVPPLRPRWFLRRVLVGAFPSFFNEDSPCGYVEKGVFDRGDAYAGGHPVSCVGADRCRHFVAGPGVVACCGVSFIVPYVHCIQFLRSPLFMGWEGYVDEREFRHVVNAIRRGFHATDGKARFAGGRPLLVSKMVVRRVIFLRRREIDCGVVVGDVIAGLCSEVLCGDVGVCNLLVSHAQVCFDRRGSVYFWCYLLLG